MARGEGIKPLRSLFEKYKKQLVAPQGSVILVFQEVVEDLLDLQLSKDQISYSVHSKTISLRVPGPLKTEIILRKKEILTHLKGRIGEKNTPREII